MPHARRNRRGGRDEKKERSVVTVPVPSKPEKPAPPPPAAAPRAPQTAKTKRGRKHPKQLDENTVRAIRRAYRPGVRLRQLEARFGLNGGTIISVANRSTYDEYPTGENEYEPPPHIRGTRRREPAPAATLQEQQALPIHRTDTKQLIPEAIQAIREAIEDGEPIGRIARSFGLAPEAIEHMNRPRTP